MGTPTNGGGGQELVGTMDMKGELSEDQLSISDRLAVPDHPLQSHLVVGFYANEFDPKVAVP